MLITILGMVALIIVSAVLITKCKFNLGVIVIEVLACTVMAILIVYGIHI